MEHPLTTSELSARKQSIARHFSQASQYDKHAYIQQQVCQHLLMAIDNTHQDSVLEVGAGTGQLTQLLAKYVQSERWSINELCEQQATHLQELLPQAQILIGDAETMDLGGEHSLVISANAIQWFDNPLHFIAQSASRLKPNGQLLLSTFTPDNFLQIKTLTGQGLHYPDISEWQSALDQAEFQHIKLSTQRFNVPFAQPYDVLKHMKMTGVSTNQIDSNQTCGKQTYDKQTIGKQTSNTQPFVWTKTRLQAFERDYWQQFSGIDEDGQPCVYLTYDVLIVDAHLP
ncbi:MULTISPECIES: methyltransferase domain-containing protein [Psychrobacter]|uniref:methyltransferase domain-containing protein n=1 Tax=Psychrobacter TaxID=497 RepID=UPI0008A6A857|nr:MULTISPECIES: methyltransferase domain-containing protein [Psychrobacter]AOY44222.1 biotin biosynthesis protein BioC [Psychrobacter sp. AntiMn-1]